MAPDTPRTPSGATVPIDASRILGDICDIAADAIIALDEAQRILLFNQGAEAIFGYTRDEIIGQPLDLLIPERFRHSHRDVHIPAFTAAPERARHMAHRREIFGLRKDGTEFPAEASISKLEIDGRLFYTVVLRDVTERHNASARLQLLADAGRELASSLDYEATLRTIANLAVQSLADFCAMDIVQDEGGVARLTVAHRDPAAVELAAALQRVPLDRSRPHPVWKVLDTGEAVLLDEVGPPLLEEIARDEEHLRLLHEMGPRTVLAVPLAARGHLLGAMLFFSRTPRRYRDPADVALAEDLGRRAALALDNARLYREAQRAIAARDDVLGILSHDLGNPLSAIFIRSRVLLRTLPQELAPAREQVEGIRTAAEEMDRLITNLLDLRRLEAGRLVLERRRHSAAALLEGVRESFGVLAAEKSLALELHCGEPSPTLHADRDRVLQVLGNLVGNAIKFTPPGGRIDVHVLQDSNAEVRFEVRDTGPGISPEQLPHLFDRFWQARHSGRRSVGLGLSIAKGIVEAHGGRIWVESEPGAGARFYFTVPAGEEKAEVPARG
ncbi:MAG TPA: ATP-binding protein [Longimicrobiales bacterium]